MMKPLGRAGVIIGLMAAGPAIAQKASTRGPALPPFRLNIAPPVQAPLGPQGRAAPDTGLFEGTKPGVGVSARSFRMEDGSSSRRTGLVGSMALAPGMTAGLGIFSVTHDDQREPEFRRNWSARNIGPRSRKVAAVGVNVRF